MNVFTLSKTHIMSTTKHLTNSSALAISALMAMSLFVHGMQLEKTGKTSLVLPIAMGTFRAIEGGSDLTDLAHTHVERGSMSEAIQHLSSPSTSRMLPREDSRKHVLSKKVVKGVHAFDGYHLPHDQA
jgi:hypothetical protein